MTITASPYQRVHRVVALIPPGRVATYGQVSRLAGVDPRVVGWALRALPAENSVPWFRVVNARGGLSTGSLPGRVDDLQARMLESEGVVLDARGRCDLEAVGWCPGGTPG